MTRKNWMMVAVALLLGGLSLYLNRDYFSKDTIQIYHRSRPARAGFGRRQPADSNVNPLTLGFNRAVRLKSLKVIPVAALETNKYAHPVWHLVSESNSIPIKDFLYGMRIQGMHPAIANSRPDPLEPGVKYRLLVESSQFKGEYDFEPVPKTP
ncbi:MAG: hypothetical protein NTX27_07040 [Verrucomicrobia bacterium]|nr:hypothetical protein [Verrucomicrobiota bacterium]